MKVYVDLLALPFVVAILLFSSAIGEDMSDLRVHAATGGGYSLDGTKSNFMQDWPTSKKVTSGKYALIIVGEVRNSAEYVSESK